MRIEELRQMIKSEVDCLLSYCYPFANSNYHITSMIQ